MSKSDDFWGTGDDSPSTVGSSSPKETTGTSSQNYAEDQQVQTAIEAAMAELERGSNPEAVLAGVLSSLPVHLQDKIKKRFQAAVQDFQARKARANQSTNAPAKAAGLRALTSLMAKAAFDKIMAVIRSRPDVKNRIQQAGTTLMRNGVVVDMVRVSEADLGNLPPSVGVGKGQEKTAQTR